jgi:hemerythrin-like domain-containing protein
MQVTQILREEHRQILRALDILETVASRKSRGQGLNERHIAELIEFLCTYADAFHQGKEEAILFPALLMDADQQHFDKVCSMIFEHNQERSLADGLKEAIQTRNTKEFLFCANRLVEQGRAHIVAEERVMLSLAESVLSPAEDARVADELLNYDRTWKQKLPRLLTQLDEMELEYVEHPLALSESSQRRVHSSAP